MRSQALDLAYIKPGAFPAAQDDAKDRTLVPHDGEPWPEYARRCATWGRLQWREARIPHWDSAICAAWWRCATMPAWQKKRKSPDRVRARLFGWNDAWWRQALRFVNGAARAAWEKRAHTARAPTMGRTHPTHGELRCRRPLDGEEWFRLEPEFVARATRILRDQWQEIPRGRRMMPPGTPPESATWTEGLSDV